MLQRMKRGYTVAEYREMLARIYATIPDAAVTSDFIVGFCGETDEDFQGTVDLVRESRFKNSFIFKYSERPGTKSADLYPDDIPEEVKRRRNNQLLAIQDAISEEQHQAFIGRTVQIMVEGPSKTSIKRGEDGPVLQLTGRTHCDRIVVFEGNRRQIGQLLDVAIYESNPFTLFGSVVTQHVGPEVYSLS
jgi:tRNA-2-methylthio-N6-dimethylallyladenosine synthase